HSRRCRTTLRPAAQGRLFLSLSFSPIASLCPPRPQRRPALPDGPRLGPGRALRPYETRSLATHTADTAERPTHRSAALPHSLDTVQSTDHWPLSPLPS